MSSEMKLHICKLFFINDSSCQQYMPFLFVIQIQPLQWEMSSSIEAENGVNLTDIIHRPGPTMQLFIGQETLSNK